MMAMRKLRKLLGLALALGVMSYAGSALAQEAFAEAGSARPLSPAALSERLKEYDVVFFGEFHDQPELHEAEKALLEALYRAVGDGLALSLEMFEADNQGRLDAYLTGALDKESFLAQSRPWPNYREDYAPLVEFAKEHGLKVLAANVPRFLAAHVAKNGSTEGIEAKYREFLPARTYAPDDAYKEKFYRQLSAPGMPMRVPPQRLAAVYAAQCLKDDKMAESMAAFARLNPEAKILHINGSFHSDGHLGTAGKLKALAPQAKIAVITPVEKGADCKDAPGDFVVYFTRVSK